MTLAEMLPRLPPVRSIPGARRLIRERLLADDTRLAVVDDDPTGTQTVHDVPVYLGWDRQLLTRALEADERVFYVSTNSRALSSEAAARLGHELGSNLRAAAGAAGASVALCSRSDSTLRGHFPAEVEAMNQGLGAVPDGLVIAPAFFEGGRYTIDDVHWVDQDRALVPAHETEFARDPSFGYGHSDLKRWVEEKTMARCTAEQVLSASLSLIREGGPEAVARLVGAARNGQPIVVNAACYEDLEVFVLGLLDAEAAGATFAYRTAASFVKVRGGIPARPLLSRTELETGAAAGLIVVGSYVQRTTRQLERLLASGLVAGIELDVPALLDEKGMDREIARVATQVERHMREGRSAAVYTSRRVARLDSQSFLETGNLVMSSLCRVVGGLDVEAGFLVAKGGITSIELARSALGVKQARVLGQIIQGVPVWKLGPQARWRRIPYVVYPGNVGADDALLTVVKKLLPR